jgi:hypothetical protein
MQSSALALCFVVNTEAAEQGCFADAAVQLGVTVKRVSMCHGPDVLVTGSASPALFVVDLSVSALADVSGLKDR